MRDGTKISKLYIGFISHFNNLSSRKCVGILKAYFESNFSRFQAKNWKWFNDKRHVLYVRRFRQFNEKLRFSDKSIQTTSMVTINPFTRCERQKFFLSTTSDKGNISNIFPSDWSAGHLVEYAPSWNYLA